MGQGLIGTGGPAAPPYRNGPYTWDQQVTFSQGVAGVNSPGKVWFVDGTSGTAGGDGKSWANAVNTITLAVNKAGVNDTIYVVPKTITDYTGDPTGYAETIIIGADTPGLSIIGVSRGRTQGGLPQIKIGSGTTAMLSVRAAGCLIANLGFNGAGSTGGGILLDDDYAAKTAFGTTITGCHFKNCKAHATDGTKGGAITWSSTGNAWQVLISGNRFYKNVADIVLVGTSSTVPQDVIIENNEFSGPAANVDVNLYLTGGGSGINGVIIRNNSFSQLPALSSGSVARYIDATGCVGMLVGNTFGCSTATTGTRITFKAAGTGAKIPVTMHVVNNWGQSHTADESGEITIV